MDLRDLNYFVAVANAGTVHRAAEQLCKSQPTLTKAIARLEASVGVELFDRQRRTLRLTHAGHVLLSRATQLLDAADAARSELGVLGKGLTGLLKLGSGPLSADYLLPSICKLVMAEAPTLGLQITLGPNYELRKQLRDGVLDVLLGFTRDKDTLFRYEILSEDHFVVAAPDGHDIFRLDRIDLAAMSRYQWALPNASVPTRPWLDSVFADNGYPLPLLQIETNSMPLVSRIITDTQLLCFVSRRTVRDSGGALREVPLAATTLARHFAVAYLPGRENSPAVGRLIELLKPGLPAQAA